MIQPSTFSPHFNFAVANLKIKAISTLSITIHKNSNIPWLQTIDTAIKCCFFFITIVMPPSRTEKLQHTNTSDGAGCLHQHHLPAPLRQWGRTPGTPKATLTTDTKKSVILHGQVSPSVQNLSKYLLLCTLCIPICLLTNSQNPHNHSNECWLITNCNVLLTSARLCIFRKCSLWVREQFPDKIKHLSQSQNKNITGNIFQVRPNRLQTPDGKACMSLNLHTRKIKFNFTSLFSPQEGSPPASTLQLPYSKAMEMQTWFSIINKKIHQALASLTHQIQWMQR